jgi:uncharacterized protein (DUF1800 family)
MTAEPAVDPGWAWAAYEPDAAMPWDRVRAGHLLRRAAFGGTWGEIDRALADGPRRAVDRLLRPEGVEAFVAEQEAGETASGGSDSTAGLRSWWLRRMVRSPHPLLERMTLLWHGRFATGNAESVRAGPSLRRLRLIRRHALGRLDGILDGLLRDPATLEGLGAAANRKARPNEGAARILLEDYTVGPGRFSAADVLGAARALTGRFVLRGELREYGREHDEGPMEVLGRRGSFGGDDLARILAEAPATARTVVREIYRAFISESGDPPEPLIAPLAEGFCRDRDIGALVERVLRSNLLFSEAVYRARAKSPVEWAVGLARSLEADVPAAHLGTGLAALGQDLFHPPTSKGWAGGRWWLDRAAVAARGNLAAAILDAGGPYGGKADPAAAASKNGRGDPEAAARFLVDLLLDGNVEEPVRAALLGETSGDDASGRLRRIAWRIAVLPEYLLS